MKLKNCFLASGKLRNCDAEFEVFNEEEEHRLKELAQKEFTEHPNRIATLAVLINFSLGLRVGELVALKWKDLKDSYLYIRRMEQQQYEKLDNRICAETAETLNLHK